MALRGTPRTAQWVRSLVLVLQQDQTAGRFAELNRDRVAALAPHAQLLLQAVVLQQADRLPAAKQLLRVPFAGPLNATYMLVQIDLLLQMGETDAARALLGHYSSALPGVMAAVAQYWISSAAPDPTLALVDFADLLRLADSPGALEEIAAALIKYPSADCFARFDRVLRASPALRQAIQGQEIWVAAVACGDQPAARFWAGLARGASAVACPPIRRIDYWSMDPANPESVPCLVNLLSLPREVISTLLSRVRPPAATHR